MALCLACGNEMRSALSCLKLGYRYEGDLKAYEPVRYGDEEDDWGGRSGRNCHDCNCPPGAYHHVGCDVERCPRCGGQVISCDCEQLEERG